MVGAALLYPRVYQEISAARGTGLQSITVLALVALATGFGLVGTKGGGWYIFMEGVLSGLIWWLIFALGSYLVGAVIVSSPDTRVNQGQLARVTAFAQSPGLLRVFGFVPAIGGTILVLAALWQLAATVVAVQQALEYKSPVGAGAVVAVGFVGWIVIMAVFKGA